MFKVSIKESSRDFTARERIAFKDTSNAIQLDTVLSDETVTLDIVPVDYIRLEVESDDERYDKIIVITDKGEKYITGSQSFQTAFLSIWEEMKTDSDPYTITVYKRKSRNYAGKAFITCSLTL